MRFVVVGDSATTNPTPLQLGPPASQPKIFSDRVGQPPADVPPQPSVAATHESKRAKTAAAPACAYVVQVSAQRTEAEAMSSYRAMQQKYPAVLGSRDANIRRVDLGDKGGIFYRAQVGSFTSSEQATAFCDNLKAAGGQCIVQRN